MRRFLSTLVSASAIFLLAACGTPRPAPSPVLTAPSPPAVPPAAATPATRSNLASEQVRLAELFRGTPVVFAMQQDGSLRATVPRRFSFDAGTLTVKPPLAAVLDRLAKSQLQTTSSIRVSAPPDAVARPATLARDRSTSVRDHLIAQGIVATRVRIGSVVPAEQVEIVVSDAAR